MSRVIIFCGKSGAGKTTLAQKLAREINVFCLSKDALKEPLYDLYLGKSLEDSNFHGQKSALLLQSLAEGALEMGVDIILEGPFNHPDNFKLFELWKSLGKDIRIIVCTIPEEQRIERLKKRQPERHASHHEEARLSMKQYENDNADYSLMPEPKIIIDSTQESAENIARILEFIR